MLKAGVPIFYRAFQKRGVLYHAQGILEEMGLENEVELLAARVHGSRSREELYRNDSDIDVVLSYRGNIREDSFFNELNAHEIFLMDLEDYKAELEEEDKE